MFGQMLRQVRRSGGITQTALAKYLDVAQQTIASWEADKSEPNYSLLGKIADYFNVSTDYLLGRGTEEQVIYLSEEQTKLLREFNLMTPDGRNILWGVLESLRISHSKKMTKGIVQNNQSGNNFMNVGGGNNYVSA